MYLYLHPAPASWSSGLTDLILHIFKMNRPPAKKFRFDSFATEFSEENIKKEQEIQDNDSGIGKFSYSVLTCLKISPNTCAYWFLVGSRFAES